MIPILSEGGLDKRKSPVVKGSSEKGKSLVATGSLGKGKCSVELQNPDSFSSNEENVPSKFPISMDIAKTIYNRVGRKMLLFTSKMMDFLFPLSYLMSHRLTDNSMNSDKQTADKEQIRQLISNIFIATRKNFLIDHSFFQIAFRVCFRMKRRAQFAKLSDKNSTMPESHPNPQQLFQNSKY